MIFGPQVADSLLLPLSDAGRRQLVLGMLESFAATFSDIRYDVYWESRTANAQAFKFGGTRFVRLMGGLARHPRVSQAGLAWTLAHETGHHLATGSPHPHSPDVRSEPDADAWARDVGLCKVFGDSLGHSYADSGSREMNAFYIDSLNF